MSKKLVVKLHGGLGNQMFQYAFGRALENHFSPDFKVLFDRNWFALSDSVRSEGTPRNYELGCFPNLKIAFASPRKIAKADGSAQYYLSARIVRKLKRILHLYTPEDEPREYIYRQTDYSKFEPAVFDPPRLYYFVGYWQNEAFFSRIENTIRHEFAFDSNYDRFNAELIEKIRGENNSVAIHVRRGDYLKANWQLPVVYYEKAVKTVLEKRGSVRFFVFGEGIEELQPVLRGLPVEWVENHNAETGQDFRDMQLMSLCRDIIVANSSFSWWAAWLGGNDPGRLVIAPSPWISGADDVVCNSWQKIYHAQ